MNAIPNACADRIPGPSLVEDMSTYSQASMEKGTRRSRVRFALWRPPSSQDIPVADMIVALVSPAGAGPKDRVHARRLHATGTNLCYGCHTHSLCHVWCAMSPVSCACAPYRLSSDAARARALRNCSSPPTAIAPDRVTSPPALPGSAAPMEVDDQEHLAVTAANKCQSWRCGPWGQVRVRSVQRHSTVQQPLLGATKGC